MAWHYDERTGNIYTLEEWREMQDRAADAEWALFMYLFLLVLKLARAAIHFFFGVVLICALFFEADVEYMIETREWILWAWLGLSIFHFIFVNKNVTRVINAILIIATVVVYLINYS